MDELCKVLSAFHISTRSAGAVEKEKSTSELDGRSAFKELPFADEWGLPRPGPGCRPCWEPPIFDYWLFEVLIAAQKELNSKEGNKEIAWRTNAFDILLQMELFGVYQGTHMTFYCLGKRRNNKQETAFWDKRWETLLVDREEVTNDFMAINERCGTQQIDWFHLEIQISSIVRTNDPTFKNIPLPPI